MSQELIQELAQSTDVVKSLVVSTGHLTYEDSLLLEKLAKPGNGAMVDSFEYGFILLLPATGPKESLYPGLSDTTMNLLQAAHKAGYNHVDFDQDGAVYENTPYFEW